MAKMDPRKFWGFWFLLACVIAAIYLGYQAIK